MLVVPMNVTIRLYDKRIWPTNVRANRNMRLPVLPCICHRSTSLKLETDCISRRLIMERARAVMYTLYGFTSHLPNAPCREFMPTQKPLVDPHATNLMLFSLVVQCKASLYIQWIH